MHIVVYGAGAVGCFLGGSLHAEGHLVTLIGRAQTKDAINAQQGLRLSDYIGRDLLIPHIRFETSEAVLAEADVVIIAVKCLAMEQVSERLLHFCRPGTRVICLQNGIGSNHFLTRQQHDLIVLNLIVSFTVTQYGHAHVHRSSSGALHLETPQHLATIAESLSEQQLDIRIEDNIESVRWARLQLSLNNAINALSGLPLRDQLQQRDYRRILASAMQELLHVSDAQAIRLAQITPIPARWIPPFLKQPDWLFRHSANWLVKVDPIASSAMQADLNRGKMTEVLYLNGAVVEAGEKLGIATPVNRALCRLVGEAEAGLRKPGLSAEQILDEIA